MFLLYIIYVYRCCCFDLLIVVPGLMTMLFQVVPEKAFILVDGSQAMLCCMLFQDVRIITR